MDNDVSAGNTTTVGHLLLATTLLAFGLGHTEVIGGVTAGDAVPPAVYVGGIALFVVGLLALRDHDTSAGTAFSALGAFWFTWGVGGTETVSADAEGLFLVLFALVALSLALGASAASPLTRGVYGLLFLALLLLAVARFGDSAGLAQIAGWIAAVSGLLAWYVATAALAHWPAALSGRAAGRGVTATG
ncbi:GPR1/FUN34/YaaH family transporter [Streptomyces poonensis]|uniref:GPR1/FUN34/yaaH family protein n=1 Tax=Streptomyces poonensis TaxID=68255 RepID=A0A918UNR5_9ACTN|nr:GPR1/FUN34/YaaH family transporter [Streptomyces poonensis]GGZ23137.1 hypothetical protein GCM10010365_49290 [Streptomyces poonensis]GLJ93679.1 hypothetical protein GCM10017589_62950 [Streptomyces poonensis]